MDTKTQGYSIKNVSALKSVLDFQTPPHYYHRFRPRLHFVVFSRPPATFLLDFSPHKCFAQIVPIHIFLIHSTFFTDSTSLHFFRFYPNTIFLLIPLTYFLEPPNFILDFTPHRFAPNF